MFKKILLLSLSSSILFADNFSWENYKKEINYDYISYSDDRISDTERTKNYIKRNHNMDVVKMSLKDKKELRNHKLALGLVFRNAKEYSMGETTDILGNVTEEMDKLDSFGLKLSSILDLSPLGLPADKFANVNVFGDLLEVTVSKRIFLDDFDLPIFNDFGKWNGPYVEMGVGFNYQIKSTIKEEGLAPMIMLGAGWNLGNEYEIKAESSIPSDYQKGTISRFSISSLF